MNVKKKPMRLCVVTREKCLKSDLIRVVINKDGLVSVDETGKANGKGAYLKKDRNVIETAISRNTLGKLFDVKIDNSIYDELFKLL